MKDIKLKMIYNKNYLEIKDYIIIDGNKIVDIGKLKLFTFNLPEIQDNLLNIGKTKFISKKIKIKEIDLIISYVYTFSDDYFSNISIKLTDELKNKLENNKKISIQWI